MGIARAEKIYKESGADALMISSEDYRFYLTGFKSSFGYVVADKNGYAFYTDPRYLEAAQNCVKGFSVKEYPRGVKPYELVAGAKTVAMPVGKITAEEYLGYTQNGLEVIDCAPSFSSLMAVKDEEEIKNISLACEATDKAFLSLLPEIKEGMTENEVAALLEFYMRKYGASGVSFDTICAFGANTSVPHHETGARKLKFGDPVLIDFGCKINGYCSDCTRTMLFGDDKKHEEFKKNYAIVLKAQQLVKENFAAGMSGTEGDAIARNYLKEYGLDEYFTHSLGHSLGVNIHESPNLSPKCGEIFKDGMVFSDEPGVYFAGEYGIRIEDTVTLYNGKIKSLTKSDANLIIL